MCASMPRLRVQEETWGIGRWARSGMCGIGFAQSQIFTLFYRLNVRCHQFDRMRNAACSVTQVCTNSVNRETAARELFYLR